MPEQTVLCIGEAMVELTLAGDRPDQAGFGFAGDTLNTAIYLKRSAPQMRVAYATKIGQDPLSDRLQAALQAEDLDTGYVMRSTTRNPGLYAITTDSSGERSFTYWRDRSAARTLLEAPGLTKDMLIGATLVYLSAITLAILPDPDRMRLIDWLGAYRQSGGRVAYDSNHRPTLWEDTATAQRVNLAAWQVTDIALPSLDDERALYEDADEAAVLARLQRWGVSEGVLKRGARGPRPVSGASVEDWPVIDPVIDTTAAGDSFNAGYLAARLGGATMDRAMAYGHALACRVIQHRGAILPRDPA